MKKDSSKRDILRDTSFFSGSVYISQTMFFLRGFLNASILGPALYGLWSALNIISSYSAYIHLGVLHALNIEIPCMNGKDSRDGIEKAKNIGFTVCFINGIIFSSIVILTGIWLLRRIPLTEFWGFVTIGLLALVSCMYEFYQTLAISLKRFMLISKASVIFSVLSVIATLALVPKFNIYGVYIVAVSTIFLNLLYLRFKERHSLRFEFNFREIFRLARKGFPILSVNFLESNIINIAGIMVISLLGKVEMGYFSVAMLASRFLIYFPQSIERTLAVHLYEKSGKADPMPELKQYLFKPTQVMSLLFPLMLVVFYLMSTFLIRHFLPKYTMAMSALLILLVGRFFVSFSPTSSTFITAMNKQRFLVPVYLMGMAIEGVSGMLFIKMGFGITGIAYSLFLSYFFIGTVTFLYSFSYYVKGILKGLYYLILSLLPLLYLLGILAAGEAMLPSRSGLIPDIMRLAPKVLLLFIMSLPLVYMANVKTGVISILSNFIRIRKHETGNIGAISNRS